MTSSFSFSDSSPMSASDVWITTSYTVRQRRIVDALRVLVGESAPALYESHDRSLIKLVGFVRSSALPTCQRLATGLQLAQELLAEEMVLAQAFDSPTAVADYLKLHFAGQAHESFVVLFLNAQHHLLTSEAMFRGTLTQTSVYPREVIKQALHHNAAAVIFAHNHPSGSTEPSRADEVLTRTLSTALALIDVRVLGHLIVAGAQSLSMAERGLL